MQDLATSTAPPKQTAWATSTANAHCSSSSTPVQHLAVQAASHAAAVTASAVSSISAQRCLIAWNDPIGLPNCSRTLAYSTAVSRHQRATPEASAAASVTAVRRTRSSAAGRGASRTAGHSKREAPCRALRSSPATAGADPAVPPSQTRPPAYAWMPCRPGVPDTIAPIAAPSSPPGTSS